jgi:bis(5'-nucleosidyl)-tetraphosphatase
MIETSAGGVIINGNKIVIVEQQFNTYSFPKGHINENETIIECAYREIYEETGLKKDEIKYIKKLGIIQRKNYFTNNPKDIHLFLFTTNSSILKPHDSDNPDAYWININDVSKKLTHTEDKEFFERIKDKISLLKQKHL